MRLEANGIRFQARSRGMVVTDGEVYAVESGIPEPGRRSGRYHRPRRLRGGGRQLARLVWQMVLCVTGGL